MEFPIIPKLSEGAFASGKRFFWFTRSKLFTKSWKMGQNIQRVGFHLYFCCAMIITSGPKQNLKKQIGPWKGRHPTFEAMQPRLLCFRRNCLPQLIFHGKFLLYTNIACGPLEKFHSKNQAKPVDMLTGGNCQTFRKNCSFGKRAVPWSNKVSVDMSIFRGPN